MTYPVAAVRGHGGRKALSPLSLSPLLWPGTNAGTYLPVDLRNPINRQHQQAQGLAAWYLALPGWMGGVRWYDLCGLNHGTLTSMGNASNGWRGTTRPGGYGSLLFDGATGFVSTSPFSVDLSGPTTVCLWVFFSSIASHPCCFAASSGNIANGLAFGALNVSGGTFLANCRNVNSGGAKNTTTTPSLNTWTHLTVVKDGSGTVASIFVNGHDVTASNNISNYDISASASLVLGKDATAASNRLNGRLDDVRLWNRALPAAEVWTVYNDSQLGDPGLLNRIPLF